jgi:hypothetical protein
MLAVDRCLTPIIARLESLRVKLTINGSDIQSIPAECA